jgi:RNA polymerase sigma factor (TIGR02999 family)
MSDDDHEITALLEKWRDGSDAAGETLMERIHRELRRIAAAYLRRERPDPNLQPTLVVNEAYIRLVPQRKVHWENRAHFYGIAAQMMRRVLVDHARRRNAVKRAVVDAPALTVTDAQAPDAGADPIDVLRLHDALKALAEIDPRQAKIVEQRYFAGLTVEEIAVATKWSPATVKRELAAAKTWLGKYLSKRR